jgi:hypothetical protein
LQKIGLSGNRIGNIGAKWIARAIKNKNSAPLEIILDYNEQKTLDALLTRFITIPHYTEFLLLVMILATILLHFWHHVCKNAG